MSLYHSLYMGYRAARLIMVQEMKVYSEVGLTDTKSVTVSPSFLQKFDNYLAAAMLLTFFLTEINTILFCNISLRPRRGPPLLHTKIEKEVHHY